MRTPMNAIIGMTAIGKAAEGIERKDYALEKIDTASNHLLGLINDVLDMSKIEAKKLELSSENFNFKKTIRKTADVIGFRVREKDQSFSVYNDEKIPLFLIGDDQRLVQVITNLLSNAVKFTPEKGSITLNADLLAEEDGLCTLQIGVKDTGIGLSGEQQERVFNSFEQAESSITRKFGGTGLGLAISKRIVEMMGGKIMIRSELGKGAEFFFTVKLKRGSENPSGAAESAPETPAQKLQNIARGKHALLAEDVEINREIVITLLKGTGLTFDSAENGKEALEMFRSNPEKYDIIFMDIQMPEMDGYEAAGRIRNLDIPRAKTVPIIAMTANVFKEDIEKALASGMDGHIGKPLIMDEVLAVLDRHLGT
jgi:CheY-like chemotaxis protein